MALQSMGGDGVCRWWSAEMIPLMAHLLGVDLNQKATNRKRRHHQRDACVAAKARGDGLFLWEGAGKSKSSVIQKGFK